MADEYDPAFPTDSLSASPNPVRISSPGSPESRSTRKSPTPVLTSAAEKIEKLIHISSEDESHKKERDGQSEAKEPVRRSRRSRSGRRNDTSKTEELTSPEQETTRGRRKSSRFSSRKEEVIEIKDEKEPRKKRTRFSSRDENSKTDSKDSSSDNKVSIVEETVISAPQKEEEKPPLKKTPFATKVKFEWKVGIKKSLISNPMRKMKDDSDEDEMPASEINGESKLEAEVAPAGSLLGEEDSIQQSENVESGEQPSKVDTKIDIGGVGFPLMKMEMQKKDESDEDMDTADQKNVSASSLSLVPRKLLKGKGTMSDEKELAVIESIPEAVPPPVVQEKKLDEVLEDPKAKEEAPKLKDQVALPMDLSRDDGKDSREPGVIIHPMDIHREGRSARSRRSRPRESDYRLSLEELHVRIVQERRTKEGNPSDLKDDRTSRAPPKKKWRNFVRQGVLSEPQPTADDRDLRISQRRTASRINDSPVREEPGKSETVDENVQGEERLQDASGIAESLPDTAASSRLESMEGESSMKLREMTQSNLRSEEISVGEAKADIGSESPRLESRTAEERDKRKRRKEGSREPSAVDKSGKSPERPKKRRSSSDGRVDDDDVDKGDGRQRSSSLNVADSDGPSKGDKGSEETSSNRKQHREGFQDGDEYVHSERHRSRDRSKDESREGSKKRDSSTDKERRKSSKKTSRRSSSRESSHDRDGRKGRRSSSKHERDDSVVEEKKKSSKKDRLRSSSREGSIVHDKKNEGSKEQKAVSENQDISLDKEREKSSRANRASSKSSKKDRLLSSSREGSLDHDSKDKGSKEENAVSENQDTPLDGAGKKSSRESRARSNSGESSANRDGSKNKENKKSPKKERMPSSSREASHDYDGKRRGSKDRKEEKTMNVDRDSPLKEERKKSPLKNRARSSSEEGSHDHQKKREVSKVGKKNDSSENLDVPQDDSQTKSSRRSRARSSSMEALPHRDGSSDRKNRETPKRGRARSSSNEASCERDGKKSGSKGRSKDPDAEAKERSSTKGRVSSNSRERSLNHGEDEAGKGKKSKRRDKRDSSADEKKDMGREQSQSKDHSNDHHEKKGSSVERDGSKERSSKHSSKRSRSVDRVRKSSRTGSDRSMLREGSHNRSRSRGRSRERQDRSLKKSQKESLSDPSVEKEHKSSRTERERSSSPESSRSRSKKRGKSQEESLRDPSVEKEHESSKTKRERSSSPESSRSRSKKRVNSKDGNDSDGSGAKGKSSTKTTRQRSHSREHSPDPSQMKSSSRESSKKRVHSKDGNDSEESGAKEKLLEKTTRQRSHSREASHDPSQMRSSSREKVVEDNDRRRLPSEEKTSVREESPDVSRGSSHDREKNDDFREKSAEQGDSGVDEPSGGSRRKRRKRGTSKEGRKHREKSPKRRRSLSKERDSEEGRRHHRNKHRDKDKKGKRKDKKSSKSDRHKSKERKEKREADIEMEAEPEHQKEASGSGIEMEDNDCSRVDDVSQVEPEQTKLPESDTEEKHQTAEKKTIDEDGEDDEELGNNKDVEDGKDVEDDGAKKAERGERVIIDQSEDAEDQSGDPKERNEILENSPENGQEDIHKEQKTCEEQPPQETAELSVKTVVEAKNPTEEGIDQKSVTARSPKENDMSVKECLNEELFMDILGDSEPETKEEALTTASQVTGPEELVTMSSSEVTDNSKLKFVNSFASSFSSENVQSKTKPPVVNEPHPPKIGFKFRKSFNTVDSHSGSGLASQVIFALSQQHGVLGIGPSDKPGAEDGERSSNADHCRVSEHVGGDGGGDDIADRDDVIETEMDISDDSTTGNLASAAGGKHSAALGKDEASLLPSNLGQPSGSRNIPSVMVTPVKEDVTPVAMPIETVALSGAREFVPSDAREDSDSVDSIPPPPPPASTSIVVCNIDASDKYSPDSPTGDDDLAGLLNQPGKETAKVVVPASADTGYAFGFERLLADKKPVSSGEPLRDQGYNQERVQDIRPISVVGNVTHSQRAQANRPPFPDLQDIKPIPVLSHATESRVQSFERSSVPAEQHELVSSSGTEMDENVCGMGIPVVTGVGDSSEDVEASGHFRAEKREAQKDDLVVLVSGDEAPEGRQAASSSRDEEDVVSEIGPVTETDPLVLCSGFVGNLVHLSQTDDAPNKVPSVSRAASSAEELGDGDSKVDRSSIDERMRSGMEDKMEGGEVEDQSLIKTLTSQEENEEDRNIIPNEEDGNISPDEDPAQEPPQVQEEITDPRNNPEEDSPPPRLKDEESRPQEEVPEMLGFKPLNPVLASELPLERDTPPDLLKESGMDMEIDAEDVESPQSVPVLEMITNVTGEGQEVKVEEVDSPEDGEKPPRITEGEVKNEDDSEKSPNEDAAGVAADEDVSQEMKKEIIDHGQVASSKIEDDKMESMEEGTGKGDDDDSKMEIEENTLTGEAAPSVDGVKTSPNSSVVKDPATAAAVADPNLEPGEILEKEPEPKEGDPRNREDRRSRDRDRSRDRSRSERERDRELERKARLKEWGVVDKENMPPFEKLAENYYVTERKKSKAVKEARRIVCECTTSREERSRGFPACGENCLNRLLMIECTSRCPCGDYCTNDKFARRDYADVGIFHAENKGHGMKALQDMKPNHFIMEYCGEVLTSSEFRSRSRQYKKEGQHHFYFMALKTDEIIDATKKGNLSRFINHSCDPNCETQKWTVNGQLRVGFFTKTHIKAGTELTFDYQFEQYGEELQKCYCGTSKCRTYIGKPKKLREQTTPRRRTSLDKRRRGGGELTDLDEDIEAMASDLDNGGLRKSEHAIKLARYMVRAETLGQRLQLLKIVQETTDSTYLKLFLSHQGLTLIWCWMVDLGDNPQELKMDILKTLATLPVSTKNAVEDSKVLSVVERWAKEESGKAESESSSSAGGTPPTHEPSDSESAKRKPTELRQIVLEASLASGGSAPEAATLGDDDSAMKTEEGDSVAATSTGGPEEGSSGTIGAPTEEPKDDAVTKKVEESELKQDGEAETVRDQEEAPVGTKGEDEGESTSMEDVKDQKEEVMDGQDGESGESKVAGPVVSEVKGEEMMADSDGEGVEGTMPEKAEGPADDDKAGDSPSGDSPSGNHVWDMAASLLESWSSLKEVYKIPKKESERDRDRERDKHRDRDRDRDRERDRHRDSRNSRDRYGRDRGGRDRDRDRDRDRRDDRRRDSSSGNSRRDSDRGRDRDYRRRKRSHSRSPERDSSSSSKTTSSSATSAKVKKSDSLEGGRDDQKGTGASDTPGADKKISKEERRALFAKKAEEEEREREAKRQREAEEHARLVAEAAQYMAETGLVPAILGEDGVPTVHPGVMVDPNNPGMVVHPNDPNILLPVPPELLPRPQGMPEGMHPMSGEGMHPMGGEGMHPMQQGLHPHHQGMVPPEHFHPDMQMASHHPHPEDLHHHPHPFVEGMPHPDHPHMDGMLQQHPAGPHPGQHFMMDQNFSQEFPHGQFMPADPSMDPNFVQHMHLEQHQQQHHQQQFQLHQESLRQEFAPSEFDQKLVPHPGEFMAAAIPQQMSDPQIQGGHHPILQQSVVHHPEAMVQPGTLHPMAAGHHPVVTEVAAGYHTVKTQNPSTSVPAGLTPQQQQFVASLQQTTPALVAPVMKAVGLMAPPPAPPRKGKKKRVTFDPEIPEDDSGSMMQQGEPGHPQAASQSKFSSVPPQATSTTFTPHTPSVAVQQPPHGILVKSSVPQPAPAVIAAPGPVTVQAQPVVLPVSQALPQPATQAAETTVTFMTPDGMLVTQTIRPISNKDAIAPGNLAHIQHTTPQSTTAPVEDVPAPPPVKVKPKRTGMPPHWKTAKDSEGKTYYYHSKTRQTQWDPPTWDESSEKEVTDTMDLGTPTYDEKSKRKSGTTTAAADTSVEGAKKLKDYFRSKMSHNVVTYLNAYRKPDCKKGRIQTTEDFKHLARKLTHHILSKEMKNCTSIEDLEVNENVKYKAREYIRKYMSKFGSVYKKDTLDL